MVKLYVSLLLTPHGPERCHVAAPASRGLGEKVSREPGGSNLPCSGMRGGRVGLGTSAATALNRSCVTP